MPDVPNEPAVEKLPLYCPPQPPSKTSVPHGIHAAMGSKPPSDRLLKFPCPNNLELLVRPNEFIVYSDPFLKKTPYVVNTHHNALICTICKHAVSPCSAVTHAHRDHSCRDIPKDFDKQLIARFPFLSSGTIQPPTTCNAIFGLAIPLELFAVCTRCRRGYTNVQSWKSHACKNADANLNGRPPHFPSHVQTFFLGSKICYFPIHTPSANGLATSDDFTLFRAQFPEVEEAVNTVVESTNYREMHQFLDKEGWVAHVANCNLAKLVGLVSLPHPDDPLANVAPNIRIILSNIQVIISKGVFHVRRLLGRRPS
jgi:hypothetical protein